MDRKRVCSTQRNIFSSLFSMDLRVDLYIFYSFFLFFLSSLRLFQKDPFRKGRYSFDEPEEPSYIRDHSRYKRVDNNLISSIARANDSHRVRGVARQNEVSANRAVWGGWMGREVTMAVPIVFLTFIPLIIPWDYYDRRWRSSLCSAKAGRSRVTRLLSAGRGNDAEKCEMNAHKRRTRGARCGDRELNVTANGTCALLYLIHSLLCVCFSINKSVCKPLRFNDRQIKRDYWNVIRNSILC